MNDALNQTDAPRALLIDLDNRPQQLEQLPRWIRQFDKVVACYGGVEPKLPLGRLSELAEAIVQQRLYIVSMYKRGKNAADFGLAFYAGRLVEQLPPETRFFVVSRDSDLDHVIHMLRAAGRSAERWPDHPETTDGTSNAESGELPSDVDAYVLRYLYQRKNRPARRETLRNSIVAHFKPRDGIDPEQVLRLLIDVGIVKINQKGRVTYPLRPSPPDTVPATEAKPVEIPF